MKRLICAILVFSLLCSLAGCQKSGGLPQSDFPLTKDVILAAQEQTGLTGVLSESDTKSYGEGHIAYTLRHPTETYGDNGDKVMTSFISSVFTDGERFLQLYFGVPAVSEKSTFAWEDWERQLEFSALLYGGFADAEEVYRVFSAMDVVGAKAELKGEGSSNMERYEWAAQLQGAYCRVRYDVSASSWSSSSFTGTAIEKWRSDLSVLFYETEEIYQERQKNYMEAYQKEQERIAAIKEARSEALKETAPWLVD